MVTKLVNLVFLYSHVVSFVAGVLGHKILAYVYAKLKVAKAEAQKAEAAVKKAL